MAQEYLSKEDEISASVNCTEYLLVDSQVDFKNFFETYFPLYGIVYKDAENWRKDFVGNSTSSVEIDENSHKIIDDEKCLIDPQKIYSSHRKYLRENKKPPKLPSENELINVKIIEKLAAIPDHYQLQVFDESQNLATLEISMTDSCIIGKKVQSPSCRLPNLSQDLTEAQRSVPLNKKSFLKKNSKNSMGRKLIASRKSKQLYQSKETFSFNELYVPLIDFYTNTEAAKQLLKDKKDILYIDKAISFLNKMHLNEKSVSDQGKNFIQDSQSTFANKLKLSGNSNSAVDENLLKKNKLKNSNHSIEKYTEKKNAVTKKSTVRNSKKIKIDKNILRKSDIVKDAGSSSSSADLIQKEKTLNKSHKQKSKSTQMHKAAQSPQNSCKKNILNKKNKFKKKISVDDKNILNGNVKNLDVSEFKNDLIKEKIADVDKKIKKKCKQKSFKSSTPISQNLPKKNLVNKKNTSRRKVALKNEGIFNENDVGSLNLTGKNKLRDELTFADENVKHKSESNHLFQTSIQSYQNSLVRNTFENLNENTSTIITQSKVSQSSSNSFFQLLNRAVQMSNSEMLKSNPSDSTLFEKFKESKLGSPNKIFKEIDKKQHKKLLCQSNSLKRNNIDLTDMKSFKTVDEKSAENVLLKRKRSNMDNAVVSPYKKGKINEDSVKKRKCKNKAVSEEVIHENSNAKTTKTSKKDLVKDTLVRKSRKSRKSKDQNNEIALNIPDLLKDTGTDHCSQKRNEVAKKSTEIADSSAESKSVIGKQLCSKRNLRTRKSTPAKLDKFEKLHSVKDEVCSLTPPKSVCAIEKFDACSFIKVTNVKSLADKKTNKGVKWKNSLMLNVISEDLGTAKKSKKEPPVFDSGQKKKRGRKKKGSNSSNLSHNENTMNVSECISQSTENATSCNVQDFNSRIITRSKRNRRSTSVDPNFYYGTKTTRIKREGSDNLQLNKLNNNVKNSPPNIDNNEVIADKVSVENVPQPNVPTNGENQSINANTTAVSLVSTNTTENQIATFTTYPINPHCKLFYNQQSKEFMLGASIQISGNQSTELLQTVVGNDNLSQAKQVPLIYQNIETPPTFALQPFLSPSCSIVPSSSLPTTLTQHQGLQPSINSYISPIIPNQSTHGVFMPSGSALAQQQNFQPLINPQYVSSVLAGQNAPPLIVSNNIPAAFASHTLQPVLSTCHVPLTVAAKEVQPSTTDQSMSKVKHPVSSADISEKKLYNKPRTRIPTKIYNITSFVNETDSIRKYKFTDQSVSSKQTISPEVNYQNVSLSHSENFSAKQLSKKCVNGSCSADITTSVSSVDTKIQKIPESEIKEHTHKQQKIAKQDNFQKVNPQMIPSAVNLQDIPNDLNSKDFSENQHCKKFVNGTCLTGTNTQSATTPEMQIQKLQQQKVINQDSSCKIKSQNPIVSSTVAPQTIPPALSSETSFERQQLTSFFVNGCTNGTDTEIKNFQMSEMHKQDFEQQEMRDKSTLSKINQQTISSAVLSQTTDFANSENFFRKQYSDKLKNGSCSTSKILNISVVDDKKNQINPDEQQKAKSENNFDWKSVINEIHIGVSFSNVREIIEERYGNKVLGVTVRDFCNNVLVVKVLSELNFEEYNFYPQHFGYEFQESFFDEPFADILKSFVMFYVENVYKNIRSAAGECTIARFYCEIFHKCPPSVTRFFANFFDNKNMNLTDKNAIAYFTCIGMISMFNSYRKCSILSAYDL